jgi:hypothetical protein
MERDYFKVTNIETGEERLTTIPPAVTVIARQKLASALEYDPITGFYAAVFGAIHPDTIMSVAKGDLEPEAYNLAMIEWMMEWEPDTKGSYDADGNPRTPADADGSDSEVDPLP